MNIYTILSDNSHLNDEHYDAELLKDNVDETSFAFTIPKEIKTNDPIYFEANFETLKWNDFPFCDVTWPIMSKKMLQTLLEIKPFRHQTIPLLMLDDTQLDGKYFDVDNKPFEEIVNTNFLALQFLEHSNSFNWEKSEYKPHFRRKDKVASIKKLIFKDMGNDFPPIFRLKVKPTNIYVTEIAKEALEKAGVRGLVFKKAH